MCVVGADLEGGIEVLGHGADVANIRFIGIAPGFYRQAGDFIQNLSRIDGQEVCFDVPVTATNGVAANIAGAVNVAGEEPGITGSAELRQIAVVIGGGKRAKSRPARGVDINIALNFEGRTGAGNVYANAFADERVGSVGEAERAAVGSRKPRVGHN